MKVPRLAGTIERRLLINFRVDPDAAAQLLPEPFRPQLVNGYSVAGICLIRLGSMRPKGLPAAIGLRSENAAHRIAVEWDTDIGVKTGVYIPRRDTSSLINTAVGGRLFPGAHHRADFSVRESSDNLSVGFAARDGSAVVTAEISIREELSGSKLFADLAEASIFFQTGSVGFSATHKSNRFDGLQLETSDWRIEAGEVASVESSFFNDASAFPPGTAELDSVLVMRQVPVTWRPLAPLTP